MTGSVSMYLLLSILCSVIVVTIIVIALKFAFKIFKMIVKFILKIEKWILPFSIIILALLAGANAKVIILSLFFSVIWYAVLIHKIKTK